MAEQTQTEDEPSIEEILDSIRQIISEDDDDEEPVIEPDPAPEPSPPPPPAVVVPKGAMDQSAIDDIDNGNLDAGKL